MLKGLPQLETLEITQSDLVSLAGIERLNKLKELKLAYLPKLVEIDAIAQVASSLRLCEFDRVPKITSYGPLEKLRELRCLVLNPGGVVPSLNFLTGLSNLEMFSFVRTTIGSGDLSPILGLKKLKQLGFFDRRGYSHKEKELKEVFGIE